MPKTVTQRRFELLHRLNDIWSQLHKEHLREMVAIGNRVPVGGSDYIDLFFKMEGIRVAIVCLRQKKSVLEALEEAQKASRYAVQRWNQQRRKDYQVHRWEDTACDYLHWTILKEAKALGVQ